MKSFTSAIKEIMPYVLFVHFLFPSFSFASEHPVSLEQRLASEKRMATEQLRAEAEQYSKIELNGKHLEKESTTTYILAYIARYRGRKLKVDEVADLIEQLRQFTDARLLDPRGNRGSPCFLGESRILTASGYRPIRDLVIGDKVLSVDVITGQLFENPIARLSRTEKQAFGILTGLGLQGADIGVTPLHPFFSPSLDDYLAISKLEPESNLMRALPVDMRQAELSLVKRGNYVMSKTLKTVFNMHLKNQPNNFCVESLVAHNMMIKF